jgi:hypothetical protein
MVRLARIGFSREAWTAIAGTGSLPLFLLEGVER